MNVFGKCRNGFEGSGKHRNGSGKVGIVPGFDYVMFIN